MGRKNKFIFRNKNVRARGRNGGRPKSQTARSNSQEVDLPSVSTDDRELSPPLPVVFHNDHVDNDLPMNSTVAWCPPPPAPISISELGSDQPSTSASISVCSHSTIQRESDSDGGVSSDSDDSCDETGNDENTSLSESEKEPVPVPTTDGPSDPITRRKIDLLCADHEVTTNESFHIVHTTFLNSVVDALSCPICGEQALDLSHKYKGGFVFSYEIFCRNCKETIFKGLSSPGTGSKDITKRLVLASKEVGLGYSRMCNFFSVLNMPKPMHHKTYQSLSTLIHDAAVSEAEKCMKKAATIVQENPIPCSSNQNTPATSVSYDGTWHKRGHSSHTGVGVAIDVRHGFVLDTHVVSNYCHGCDVGPKPDSAKYLQWKINHKCHKNFGGSSNAMETEAALVIFRRSVVSRGLIYSEMLCDGDAKANQKINEEKIYAVPVEKKDCINHISKRMFNNLTTLKNSNKKELNRKFTKQNIEKVTNVYASNLKRSAPDVIQMKQDVLGGIYHMISSDTEPQHDLCPEGIMSWCFYNRAKALGEEPRRHRQTFKPEILKWLMPVVERLTQPDLLKRCADMQTQNANECFNGQIWNRCPKTIFMSKASVETAVALSVLAFNCGPKGIFSVLEAMKIDIGLNHSIYSDHQAATRVKKATKRGRKESKWARKQRKSARLRLEDSLEAAEGTTYMSGAFNS